MDGIRVRNRSEERISILHILRVQVLHDIIREFARDSFPSIACNFVRDVAAMILEECPWERKWTFQADPENWDDDRRGEWYARRHLEHGFSMTYQGHGLVHLHHRTIANSEDDFHYWPEVKHLVLRWETRDEEDRGEVRLNRFHAWERRVEGRTWTAVCKDDWHMRPANSDDDDIRLWVLAGEPVYIKNHDTIGHIVDLSTLTLME